MTGVAAGSCGVTANQAGNSNFSAAPAALLTIVIGTRVVPSAAFSGTRQFSEYVGVASAPQVFTLTNTSPGPIALTTVGLTTNGTGDFAIVGGSDACSGTVLAAGASCTIGVTFTPKAIGTFIATLAASSSTPGAPAPLTIIGLVGVGR